MLPSNTRDARQSLDGPPFQFAIRHIAKWNMADARSLIFASENTFLQTDNPGD